MSTSLEALQKELKSFQYKEDSELTNEETEILKQMFSVKGSFKALFKYLCTIEGENGTQLTYEIEQMPTVNAQTTPQAVADAVKFSQILTRFVRSKMENIRITFEKELSEKVDAKEKQILADREKYKKKEAENDLVVAPDM